MIISKNNISKIESILYKKSIRMEKPVMEHDLGALYYFSTKFKYSEDYRYKKKSLKLYNKFIEVFSEFEFQTGILEGLDGIGLLLSHLKDCGIILTDDILKDIEPYLFQSIRLTNNNNNFDLLYGSIGKIQYLLKNDRYKEKEICELINNLVDKLYHTRIEKDNRIFWYELESDKVNLGLSHGITSVFVFLLQLKKLNFNNQYLDILIKGIINSFLFFENKTPSMSHYGSGFPYTRKTLAHSRLAWCYGDLGIAYSFLYGSKILNDKKLYDKYLKMLNSILQRGISDSGLVHFSNYSFFDTGFCHGISGIYYILFKYNELNTDPVLENKLDYWKDELLKNLNIQLKIKDKIFFPKEKQGTDEIYFIENESMLNGLCGVALVLLSLQYKKGDWSNFFLLL